MGWVTRGIKNMMDMECFFCNILLYFCNLLLYFLIILTTFDISILFFLCDFQMCYVILLPFSYHLQYICHFRLGITGGSNQLGDWKKSEPHSYKGCSPKAHIAPEAAFTLAPQRGEKVYNQHEIGIPNANPMQPYSTVLLCPC